MTMFIVSPAALDGLSEELINWEVPLLDEQDDIDDYSMYDGGGLWICPFLEFLEKQVRRYTCAPHFEFSDKNRLDDDLLAEITSLYVRALLIEFINESYKEWRDCDVDVPDYGDYASDCRDFCDGCDRGWSEIYGEYDGLLAEDVEEDEDEEEEDISRDERDARHDRNVARADERDRRQAAQKEAEGEVVDREFVCDHNCSSFNDHVDETYAENFEVDLRYLKRKWINFITGRNLNGFPPL